MFKFLFPLILIPSVCLGVATETKNGADILKVGKPSSSYNSEIKLLGTNVSIRGNRSTGDGEWTKDGVNWKKLGSGSGGGSTGSQILGNPSFEDGVEDGWNNSGGSFTPEEYINATDDNAKYAQFVSTTPGEYFETDLTVIPDDLGVGCQAQMEKYATATSEAWKISALDSSGNVLSTQNMAQSGGASTFIASPLISFPCPVAGQTAKLRIESLAAATIKVDKAYLGGNKNVVDIAQSRRAGNSYFPGNASCTLPRANSVLGSPTDAAACLGPVIENSSMGQWQTTDVDNLKQTINNLPAGKYVARFEFWMLGSGNNIAGATVSDGTTSCRASPVAMFSTTYLQSFAECEFNYSAAGNRTFSLFTASTTGTVTIYNDLAAAPLSAAKFSLTYFPNDTQTGVTSEQSGWMIDARIGGANPSLGTADVTSYTEITNASLDLVVSDKSSPVKIACSATNASTGPTCSSGSESLGISFSPPVAGIYDVCFDITTYINNGSSNTTTDITYQVIETTPGTQTILQEGGTKSGPSFHPVYSSTSASAYPQRICGVFKFNSVSEKTVRLMYEMDVGGSSNSQVIEADRSSSLGQREIKVSVRPSTSNSSRPVLTGDQVTSPGVNNVKTCYSNYGGAGSLTSQTNCGAATPTCVEYNDTCTTFSQTRSATGTYSLTAAAGTCKANSWYFCSYMAENGANGIIPKYTTGNLFTDGSGGFSWSAVTQIDGGSNTDTRTAWKCECVKP